MDTKVMKNYPLRPVAALVLLILSLMAALAPLTPGNPSVALAAPATQSGDTGLQVSGALLDLSAKPGQVYVHNMVVSSGTKAPPMDVTVEALGFGESPSGSFQGLPADQDKSPYSARTMITKIDKPAFHLDPGQAVPVNATITVPADIGTDTRYAVIYIHSQPVAAGEGVSQILATTVPVVITPPNAQLNRTGSITDFKVSPVEAGKPIEVLTSVQNTGNRHFKVQGKVIISDAAGQAISTLPLPLTGTSIFPTFVRQLRATYSPLERAGGLPAGNYTAEVQITREDGSPVDGKSTTFVVPQGYRPLPGIPEDQLVTFSFKDQEPGMVDASAKADMQITFEATGKVTGTVAAGKYPQEPAGTPRFADRPGDGGAGGTGVKFLGAQVDGFSQGTAHFKVFYRPNELGSANPNSLFLAYRDGNTWTKLANLAVQTGAQAVLGDLPVSVLAKGPVIALGSDNGGAAPPAPGLPIGPAALAAIGGIAVIGMGLGVVIARRAAGQPRIKREQEEKRP
jgi:hypothetical protein